MTPKILLVEDEPGLVLTLTDRLTSEGYAVESAMDGEAGLARGLNESFDLILLDVMLPKRSGLDVCRKLREAETDTPIIMLTARDQVVDKVVGLKTGADDYVTKPFDMMELLARIEALLRRAPKLPSPSNAAIHRFGNVEMDTRKGVTTRNGETISLSAREYRLLRYLAERRGTIVSRDELLKEVWGYDHVPETRTVDVHMAWLRQKLEENPKQPEYILTVRGLGYKLAG